MLPLAGGGFNAEGSPLEPAVRRRYRMSNQFGGVMTNKVWMVGTMLIAFVIGMMFSQNTTAQEGEIGRLQIATAGATRSSGARGTLFILDTVNGDTYYCSFIIGGDGYGEVNFQRNNCGM